MGFLLKYSKKRAEPAWSSRNQLVQFEPTVQGVPGFSDVFESGLATGAHTAEQKLFAGMLDATRRVLDVEEMMNSVDVDFGESADLFVVLGVLVRDGQSRSCLVDGSAERQKAE